MCVCTPMWPYMLKCLTTQSHGGSQWRGQEWGRRYFSLYIPHNLGIVYTCICCFKNPRKINQAIFEKGIHQEFLVAGGFASSLRVWSEKLDDRILIRPLCHRVWPAGDRLQVRAWKRGGSGPP